MHVSVIFCYFTPTKRCSSFFKKRNYGKVKLSVYYFIENEIFQGRVVTLAGPAPVTDLRSFCGPINLG